MNDYPEWICWDCGSEHGRVIEGHIATYRRSNRRPAPRTEQGVMKMENAQTENSATGGASALTDVLERMRTRADNAYCDYIGQLRRDECLGWEIKVERQEFGEAELKAHCAAAEKLGRHRALYEAAKMLEEALRSNIAVFADGANRKQM